MQINFTEQQKANIWHKLKQSAEIKDVQIMDNKIMFTLTNNAKIVSGNLTSDTITFLKRQMGFEKEFIERIYNIFISL